MHNGHLVILTYQGKPTLSSGGLCPQYRRKA
ncbi:Uncharacterised protein [Vibrio cholerae]|nr:Uncharacterised protein [Vibrio cholerae]